MLYKAPEVAENQSYVPKQETDDSYDKLYPKPEPSTDHSSGDSGMFSSSLTAMTSSSPTSSPTYQDQQTTNNLSYPYVPGSRSVLPSMQYLSNGNQTTSASFWGMQPSELGYSHAPTGNSTTQLSKPFPFDPSQNSGSPTTRAEGMSYSSPGSIARPNPYPSYMGTDISPWSMAIQHGLQRIGAGKIEFIIFRNISD